MLERQLQHPWQAEGGSKLTIIHALLLLKPTMSPWKLLASLPNLPPSELPPLRPLYCCHYSKPIAANIMKRFSILSERGIQSEQQILAMCWTTFQPKLSWEQCVEGVNVKLERQKIWGRNKGQTAGEKKDSLLRQRTHGWDGKGHILFPLQLQQI